MCTVAAVITRRSTTEGRKGDARSAQRRQERLRARALQVWIVAIFSVEYMARILVHEGSPRTAFVTRARGHEPCQISPLPPKSLRGWALPQLSSQSFPSAGGSFAGCSLFRHRAASPPPAFPPQVLSGYNIIDLLAILPWYLERASGGLLPEGVAAQLRVLRVIRLLRLLRHSADMQACESGVSEECRRVGCVGGEGGAC